MATNSHFLTTFKLENQKVYKINQFSTIEMNNRNFNRLDSGNLYVSQDSTGFDIFSLQRYTRPSIKVLADYLQKAVSSLGSDLEDDEMTALDLMLMDLPDYYGTGLFGDRKELINTIYRFMPQLETEAGQEFVRIVYGRFPLSFLDSVDDPSPIYYDSEYLGEGYGLRWIHALPLENESLPQIPFAPRLVKEQSIFWSATSIAADLALDIMDATYRALPPLESEYIRALPDVSKDICGEDAVIFVENLRRAIPDNFAQVDSKKYPFGEIAEMNHEKFDLN